MTSQPKNKLNFNYAFILGIILSLFTAYSYAIDNSLYFSYLALGLLLLSVPVFGLIAIISAKKKAEGFINFKEAMKNYTLTITVGLLISTITSILIFNVVDTDFYKTVQQIQVDGVEKQKTRTLQQMYSNNTPEKTIEDVEKKFDDSIEKIQTTNQYSLSAQIKNLIKSIGAYLLFGLILAAILKKHKPQSI